MLLPSGWTDHCITHFSYYFFSLLVVAFLGLLTVIARGHWQVLRRGAWRARFGILLAALLAVWMDRSEPDSYKTLMDEALIAGMAQMLHLERDAVFPLKAHYIRGSVDVLQVMADKRMGLVSTLMAWMHDIAGYNIRHVYFFNALCGFLLLLLSYFTFRTFTSEIPSLLGVLILAGIPEIVRLVSGAGFELFNLVMLLATMLTAIAYQRNPTLRHQSLLCLATVLLAYVRYESVLFVLATGLIILGVWWSQRSIQISAGLWAAPLLLVPYLWGHMRFHNRQENWQLWVKDHTGSVFSPEYLGANLLDAMEYFLIPADNLASAWSVGAMGIVALLCASLYFGRQLIRRQWCCLTAPLLPYLLTLVALFLLLMFYFWGQLTDRAVSRLSIGTYLLMVFAIVWLIQRLCSNRTALGLCIGIVALSFAGVSMPAVHQHLYAGYYPPSTLRLLSPGTRGHRRPSSVIFPCSGSRMDTPA